MSDKNKTIIIIREPNIDIPEAYLRKVLAACPSGGGYAVQSVAKEGHPELITDHMDTGIPLADVQDLLKSAASHRILFAFNKLEKMDEKFLQPFNVAIDGDDVLLSFGIDGHFPTMIEAGHTEESLLAQRVMFPNLQKLIKFSAGDLNKFIAELRDQTFIDLVMSRIGDRGAYCFLPPVGEAIWYGKNKAGSTFPWGQTSDTLGYTEEAAKAPPTTAEVKAEAKKGWWGKSKGPEVPVAQDAPVEQPVAPAAPPPPSGPVNIPAPAPDTTVKPPPADKPPELPPGEVPTGHWEKVGPGLNRDQRKKLIRRVTNCGSVLPDNWAKDPFWYYVVDYVKDDRMVELAQKAKDMKAETTGPKDFRQPAPRMVVPKSGVEVDVLLMTKDERSGIETHILNVLGYNAKHIQTPMDIQKMEAGYAKFSDEFGVKLEILNGWSPKQLRLLGPKALTHYVLELRRKLIEQRAKDVDGDTSVNTEAVNDKPAAPAPATESASPAPKKGYWGKQKAA